ncbi:hypothetical protein ACFY2H_18450 [Streptomyces griseofuscus]|uniref:Uncharacterized protein n=1 Tax=Streptomyces griseofuscus TaxID=146922 RepID=A0A7H1PW37_9ACTN|nr:YbhB/YbcL family Raf kinase inhibitor-like protein [Streptomyces griseofuscus]QNT92267.1 hypothetical protein HEP81_01940 [Streptomyces griseofuscus]BBC92932.1 hypothetical protein SRO_1756 [Streptomyces rochei]
MRKSSVTAATVLTAATGRGGGTGDATGAASPTGRTVTTTPAAARRFTYDGADVSPPIDLAGVPADTRAPGRCGISTRRAAPSPTGCSETPTRAPADCPPHGDRPHRHVLTVYATDRHPPLSPDASSGASLDDLRRALVGHSLATGTLTGRHGR